MKPNVLFVGEHPTGISGNSHMLAEILRQVDYNNFNVSVFAATKGIISNVFTERLPYNIIEGGNADADGYGRDQLRYALYNLPDINIVVFVGIDLWRYSPVFNDLINIRNERRYKWAYIFPYDLISFRQDWVDWMKPIDFPCVYSEYGYNLLKDYVPNLRYFRPPLFDASAFVAYPKEIRKQKQAEIFKILSSDAFVFGFFGINMMRKDPQRLIKAFYEVKKEFPNAHLYFHTELTFGDYNLEQYMNDLGKEPSDAFIKTQGQFPDSIGMCSAYNIVDCLVAPSLQEGLNWTILESFLCGTPVIASDSTAHKELLADGTGILIPCTDLAYLPVQTKTGTSWVETRACDFHTLVETMKEVMTNPSLREHMRERGLKRAQEWLSKVSNINELLNEAAKHKVTLKSKKKAVLFAQHSSAGDVLMSTQCLKGIKERHKNLPLIYMTQKQYQDIVINNPYIDEIIDWDSDLRGEYQILYDPHGQRILPGGFNNLDATLYSMYPYFCKVEPDEMFIECIEPKDFALASDYMVIHTTGGDPRYRTYNHMNIVIRGIDLPSVQLGGKLDKYCDNVDLDLRGKLSFRESAWVMKHAKVAIVIDSFLAHLAGHLRTPVVVLYGPAPARVTQPRADKNKLINLEPNKLDVCKPLTSCWGKPNEGACDSPCINTINPQIVIRATKELLSR